MRFAPWSLTSESRPMPLRVDELPRRRLPNRRGVLRGGLALAGVAALGGPAALAREEEGGAGPELIIRSSWPLDAETPTEVFDRWLTPNRLFFIRSHFGAPAVGLAPWSVQVDGLVDR